jgi:hypothetical protein
MFKMIGGDGREYGPVSAEQLREWIADRRANGQTQVQAVGSNEWVSLSQLPEFGAALGAAIGAAATAGPPEPAAAVATLVGRDGRLRVSDCLGRGWQLLGQHFLLAVGGATLVWLLLTLAAISSCIGGLLSLVVSGALYGGLTVLYLNLIRGRPAGLGDIFAGFGPAFVPLMLVWIVTHVLSELGLVFCLVPGIFLKVIWVFGVALVADKGLAFWPALELSRRTVLPRFGAVLGLLALAFLPLIVFEVYNSYRATMFLLQHLGPLGSWRLLDLQPKLNDLLKFAAGMGLQEQLVLLLNLPFATAAVLYAYEHFFGSERSEDR